MRQIQVNDYFRIDVSSNVVTDPTRPIEYGDLCPHYTDSRFLRSAGNTGYMLVFGDPETLTTPEPEGLTRGGWDSDRIAANTPKGFTASGILDEVAQGLGLDGREARLTGRFHEQCLRAALASPALDLIHMISWVNAGNGYPGISYRWLQPTG